MHCVFSCLSLQFPGLKDLCHHAGCRELLSHGADTAHLDAESRSPADVAHLNSFPRIAELVKPKPGEVEARIRQVS